MPLLYFSRVGPMNTPDPACSADLAPSPASRAVVASRHHVPPLPYPAEGRQAPPVLEHRGDPSLRDAGNSPATRPVPRRDQRQPAGRLAQDDRGLRGRGRAPASHRPVPRGPAPPPRRARAGGGLASPAPAAHPPAT